MRADCYRFNLMEAVRQGVRQDQALRPRGVLVDGLLGLRETGGLGTHMRGVSKTALIGMIHNWSHIQLVADCESPAQRILRVRSGCKASD